MKTKILSLTVLLLAGAASGALAQDNGRRDRDDQPAAQGGPPRTMYDVKRQQAERHAPQPAPPPRAAPRDERGGERPPPQARGPGPGEPRVIEQDRRGIERGPRDGDRRDDRRDWRGRDPDRRDGDPRGWDRRDGDRRPDAGRADHRDDHRDDARRWDRDHDRGRDWDRDRNRDWDRDRHDRPRWDRDRYPPIYNSPSRYRGPAWRPPYGYYVRTWRFGEILPRGWYAEDYRIPDWWAYDLPEPPYGYDWVRVGPDVLLIDLYTGRIAQVVRLVFW